MFSRQKEFNAMLLNYIEANEKGYALILNWQREIANRLIRIESVLTQTPQEEQDKFLIKVSEIVSDVENLKVIISNLQATLTKPVLANLKAKYKK